jgi:hypothetical protein
MDERNLSTSDLADASADEPRADETRADDTRPDETPAAEAPAADDPLTRERGDDGGHPVEGRAEPLFPADEAERFEARWMDIQTAFVDEPRQAVEQADALVADLMQRLASSFAAERQGLEAQWDSGDDVSTEDLRVALKRYRSFFGRLLSA